MGETTIQSQQYEIRRATPDDAPAIAEVFITARARCMDYLPKLHTDDDTRAWIANVVCCEHEVFVATDLRPVVGFVALIDSHLDHLYVDPDHHGRGIGTMLLRKAMSLRPDGFT